MASCWVPDPVFRSQQALSCWNSLSENALRDGYLEMDFRCLLIVVPVLEWEDDLLSSAVW